jgi:uncharacterized protein YdaL
MLKSTYLICLLVLVAFCVSVEAATKNVLILYDQGEDKQEPALADARYLTNLLGHFDTNVKLTPVKEYKPGSMDSSDVVFYVSYENEFVLPEVFKREIFGFKNTFCWINNQLGELDQKMLLQKYGFHFKEYNEDKGFNRVIYNNVVFPKGDENINIVEIDKPSAVKVKAYAVNKEGVKAPYIVHSGKFWFVADSPFAYSSEKDRYLAFADVLHDIVGENHRHKHTGLVRIEDVNPTSDPKSLITIVKYLKSQNVPFAVALVPVYVNPKEKVEIHLGERPELLSVLKEIPNFGGSFVLHGYTHQYHGVTPEDYEFWDDVADKPVIGDSVEYASLRIEKAIKECIDNGIYPLAWETPHYVGSENTYLAVKKFFSVVYGRRNVMEYIGTDQFFPYPVKDVLGQEVIPENLGYIRGENPQPQELLSAAKLNLALRDGYASFFFHPFMNIDYLRTTIKGLKSMGYKFADIKEFSPVVSTKDLIVLTRHHNVLVETRDKEQVHLN